MEELILLDKDQVFGYNQLEIFKKRGTNAVLTDFAILLGGETKTLYPNEDNVGMWWTKTSQNEVINVVGKYGEEEVDCTCNIVGIRPAIKDFVLDQDIKHYIRKDDVIEVVYGEYPQMAVSEEENEKLEKAYQEGKLEKSKKVYTSDSYEGKRIIPKNNYEYLYKGKKYVRMLGNNMNKNSYLSNGMYVEKKEAYWIEVKPLLWLYDKYSKIAITENIIVSGISFLNEYEYDGYFENTDIKDYLDNYLRREIVPSKVNKKEEPKEQEEYKKDNKIITFTLINGDKIIEIVSEGNLTIKLDKEELTIEKEKVKTK